MKKLVCFTLMSLSFCFQSQSAMINRATSGDGYDTLYMQDVEHPDPQEGFKQIVLNPRPLGIKEAKRNAPEGMVEMVFKLLTNEDCGDYRSGNIIQRSVSKELSFLKYFVLELSEARHGGRNCESAGTKEVRAEIGINSVRPAKGETSDSGDIKVAMAKTFLNSSSPLVLHIPENVELTLVEWLPGRPKQVK